MRRKNEMHIKLLLLNIIILTSLIIASGNASGQIDDRFQRDQRVDRSQHDSSKGNGDEIYNIAGWVNINGAFDLNREIYNVAGTINMNGGIKDKNTEERSNDYSEGGGIDSSHGFGCRCGNHCEDEIHNGAGTVNMNGGCSVGSEIYNGAGTVNINGG